MTEKYAQLLASLSHLPMGVLLFLICSADAYAIFACDQDAYVHVVATAAIVPESGGATAQFVFSTGDIGAGGVDLTLQISGTATNGVDYTTLPNHVTIPFNPSGPPEQAALAMTPIADAITQGAKTVTVTIVATNGGCVHVGYPSSATITIVDAVAPTPLVTHVVSRKAHGVVGTFDLPLGSIATNPTTEPRAGPAHDIVFVFDKPVIGGNAALVEGSAVAGVPTFNGNEMTVPLLQVANQQFLTMAVSGVVSADGGTGGGGSVRIGFLAGDVSQNRVVTLSDLGQVNAQVAQTVTAANFLKDVNASGTLSLADKGLTNQQLTNALPAP
jgi:hypothetical protein